MPLAVKNGMRFGVSGNVLKLLGAASMLVDHIGYIFFPQTIWLRAIGRLAFPIFAFMIEEGCHYTRNKLRCFLQVLVLAVVCQSALVITGDGGFLCVPVSFSLAIPMVYALQACKNSKGFAGAAFWGSVFLVLGSVAWWVSHLTELDYGFWGCMLPVAASLLRRSERSPAWLKKLDIHAVRVLCMGVCLAMMSMERVALQWLSLLALPLLLCYNGGRGKWKMKYFFYIFYPAHLVLLQGMYWLIYGD